MDNSTIVIIGLFVLFGALEYQRRERTHRNAIAWMRVGRTPDPAWDEPPLWKLFTTVAVTLILFGFIGFLGVLGVKGGIAGPVPLLVVAATLIPVLLILILMIIRDYRKYSSYRRRMNGIEEGPP